jgi:hypothetical protein
MKFSRFIRFTAMLLISVLLSSNLAFATKKPVDPAVLKAKIQARGVGQGVRVTLTDATDVTGMIISIGDQSFALRPKKKNAQPQEIAYGQLTAVHKDKLSRGQKVTVVVVIVSASIAVLAVIATHELDESWGSGSLP